MSQNAANLTFQLLDVGCGIVSAFNALQLLQHPVDISIIAGAFMMVKCGDLHSGVGPVQLHHCIDMVLRHTKSDLQVRLVEPANVGMLRPGSLIYVQSALLGHVCLPDIFGAVDSKGPDSHIVMVEQIHQNGVTVINPDTSDTGCDMQWGRFKLTHEHLHQVWRSSRADGSGTTQAAIILEMAQPTPIRPTSSRTQSRV